jgi:hypothetical protein
MKIAAALDTIRVPFCGWSESRYCRRPSTLQ